MLTNEFSGAALASLRAARLGFPAENARAVGKRRHHRQRAGREGDRVVGRRCAARRH